MKKDGFYVQEIRFVRVYEKGEIFDGETISESYHETLDEAKERLEFLRRAYEANGWKVKKHELDPNDPLYPSALGKYGGFDAEKDGVDYFMFVCVDSAADVM